MTLEAGPRQKHLDHIVAIAIGGTHTRGNVRVICATCNLARPHDGSDLNGHQSNLWASDLAAAQVATVLRTQRRSRRLTPKPRPVNRVALLRRQLWTEKARAAATARRLGLPWQTIADILGYGSPGAAHNAIRLRLHVNPSTIFKPGQAA